jgi:hypothetical protein
MGRDVMATEATYAIDADGLWAAKWLAAARMHLARRKVRMADRAALHDALMEVLLDIRRETNATRGMD